MATKQVTKTPDALLRHPDLLQNPHQPISETRGWRDFANTLDAHRRVRTSPPSIELKSNGTNRWQGFRRDNNGTGFDYIPANQGNPCPQTLKIVKVAGTDGMYFDDLAGALDDVNAAPPDLVMKIVHANVSHFHANAICADVGWYPYAVRVELRGDTGQSVSPQKVTIFSTGASIPCNWYETSYLWLTYSFPHGSMEQPSTSGIAPSLDVWLDTGEAGKTDKVGIDNPETSDIDPTGWVIWEPSDLTTKLATASALRKHLWSAKGNHVFVRVDDSDKLHISQILIPS